MIRVYTSPYANDGILRVIEAQREHLPKFDVEMISDPKQADVICNHGTSLTIAPGVPNVAVCHGMYWSRQKWGDDFMDVNRAVVDTMLHAVAHTVPSEWVGRAVRRGGFWYPEVVYHGIDGEKFLPGKTTEKYVLWNKARADYVSDPKDLMALASYMQKIQFFTTIGRAENNVKVIGPQPHPKMKKLISEAGVYLATARETFGIGTLEALAYGVPVAGWDWGGQHEIIINGVTGYLAPPGDYKALAHCVELCFAERKRLSDNAIADVRTRWKWEPRIEQYANIFKRVHDRYNDKRHPKVSIIVTAYKLDEYLAQCLSSIQVQTYQDFECLVIDDANLSSTRQIVSEYAQRDKRFRYIATPQNLGLPGARNFGLSNSSGQYIRHVDADDFLADNAIALETSALDEDSGIHIVYGHLEVIRPDGSRNLVHGEPVRSGWPKENFNWYEQMAHLNQLPSCAMARREVYERTGGYRERMRRQEDAEFWCRVTSLGFRAKKITQAVTYFHRERADSKGALEWNKEGKEPDWTAWFPWRMGSSDLQQAQELFRVHGQTPRNPHLVPFGAQGKPPKEQRFWYVHDYAYPVVSIILTCGPGHQKYLIDALDSIQAQTYPDWECILVNDTGEKWSSDYMGAPWAKVINMDGNQGVAKARNEGYRHASGRYIIWMDADDFWLPWFLQKMVSYAENNNGVIYSDIFLGLEDGSYKLYSYLDFQSILVPTTMQYPGSSILYPRQIVDALIAHQGGFDADIPGMEDWDYQITVHHLGFCAYRIPEPLFVYRMYSSTKRDRDYAKIDAIKDYLDRKYGAYRKGEKQLMCGCSRPKVPPSTTPSSTLISSGNFTEESIAKLVDNAGQKPMMVLVEYLGPSEGTFSIKSRVVPDITYRFGNNNTHRSRAVLVQDAEFLIGQRDGQNLSLYRIVPGSNVIEANDPAAFLGAPLIA